MQSRRKKWNFPLNFPIHLKQFLNIPENFRTVSTQESGYPSGTDHFRIELRSEKSKIGTFSLEFNGQVLVRQD